MQKKHDIDMVNGPLFGKIVLFSVPLMLSGILQLLFNAADIIVVGRFCGKNSIAAVGSTGSTINLVVAVCIGFSIGTSVLTARFYGGRKTERLSVTVHTSILFAFLAGIGTCIVGQVTTLPLLRLMATPEEVIGLAAVYMRIYYAGLPALFLYNFGAAILRATGDTVRPMYYLTISGVLNVLLNVCFVVIFGMNVEGVAYATVISECLSAVLVILTLIRTNEPYKIIPKNLAINKKALLEIVKIGLPASLQSAVFSISNMQIQSSVNSFGAAVMAGNAAANSLGGFIYTAMNAVTQASITFTSQNYGAGKRDRINKVLLNCLLAVSLIGISMSLLCYFFGRELLGIYTTDPTAIETGMLRLAIMVLPYFLCGCMEVICGAVRGIGYDVLPMLISLIGACAFRVFWVSVIFHAHPTLTVLYISYPISWVLTGGAHFISFTVCKKKVFARFKRREEAAG